MGARDGSPIFFHVGAHMEIPLYLMWEPICSHPLSHLALLDWLHPMWEPIMGVLSDPMWEAVMEVPSTAMRPREPVSSHVGAHLLSCLDWLHPVATLFHPMMALLDVLSIQVCFVSPHRVAPYVSL